MSHTDSPVCPYCNQTMKKWKVPIHATWPHDFFYVCFNDRCPYFVRGWTHLWNAQHIRASFRCRLDPDTGKYVPLPVWSTDALKEDVIDA